MAFFQFLILAKLKGLDYWMGFTNLLCHSEEFSRQRPLIFKKGMRIFYNMLKQMPKDFFYDNLTKDNFLKSGMIHLMEILDEFEDQNFHSVFDQLLKSKANFL